MTLFQIWKLPDKAFNMLLTYACMPECASLV
jgi:hypothetical protein